MDDASQRNHSRRALGYSPRTVTVADGTGPGPRRCVRPAPVAPIITVVAVAATAVTNDGLSGLMELHDDRRQSHEEPGREAERLPAVIESVRDGGSRHLVLTLAEGRDAMVACGFLQHLLDGDPASNASAGSRRPAASISGPAPSTRRSWNALEATVTATGTTTRGGQDPDASPLNLKRPAILREWLMERPVTIRLGHVAQAVLAFVRRSGAALPVQLLENDPFLSLAETPDSPLDPGRFSRWWQQAGPAHWRLSARGRCTAR